jgi:hypothetical protein
MAWSPKTADSREAGYIYANRPVSEDSLRLQKRSGPYISLRDVLQDLLLYCQIGDGPPQLHFSFYSSFIFLACSTCRPAYSCASDRMSGR